VTEYNGVPAFDESRTLLCPRRETLIPGCGDPVLRLEFAGGPPSFDPGKAAEKWAEKNSAPAFPPG